MGILEGLKRTLNIAGAKIIVALENNKISQSDLIKGGVVVTAPEYRLSGSSIKIELKEHANNAGEDLGNLGIRLAIHGETGTNHFDRCGETQSH